MTHILKGLVRIFLQPSFFPELPFFPSLKHGLGIWNKFLLTIHYNSKVRVRVTDICTHPIRNKNISVSIIIKIR